MSKILLILSILFLASCANKPKPVVGTCDGMIADFSNQEQAIINIPNNFIKDISKSSYTLQRIVSASGSTYINTKENISFGIKGNNGRLTIKGHDLLLTTKDCSCCAVKQVQYIIIE